MARERHAPALAGLSELRVVGLADPDAEAAGRLAPAFAGARVYADHAALLAGQVEAVAVLVPADAHTEVILAALDAGKHVFVEKPLCLSVADAQAIGRRVDETGLTLVVGFNLRHHPLVRDAAARVSSGALGEVVAVQSAFTTTVEPRARVLAEHAPHHFDLWRFLLRDEVDRVCAFGDDATAVLAATTRKGVAVSFVVSQRSANVNECVVYGTRASLRLAPYRFDGLELQSTNAYAGDVSLRLRRLAAALPALRRTRGAFVGSYREEWRAFVRAVRGGAAEPGFEDGLRNVQLLLAAIESADRGVPVSIGA